VPESVVPRPRSYYTEPSRLEVGGLEVAYRRKGEGEPVLYLHAGAFTRMWLPFHERLSQSVDLIAPEHPGYGETPMPDWLDGFDDLVIHYAELLEELGLERVHVVGHSLGGWIAAELAVFYPERLRSLTLIVPIGLRIEGKPWPNLAAMTPQARLDRTFNDKANMAAVTPDADDLDEVTHLYGEATTMARLAWSPQYDLKLEHRLRRVKAPALVLRAEHDRLIPDEMAERYAELLPNARIEAVPGTGHGLPIEQPDRAAGLVADFVAEAAR
jgi:pimeloyl-ACP methyl ester carboxylesterase